MTGITPCSLHVRLTNMPGVSLHAMRSHVLAFAQRVATSSTVCIPKSLLSSHASGLAVVIGLRLTFTAVISII